MIYATLMFCILLGIGSFMVLTYAIIKSLMEGHNTSLSIISIFFLVFGSFPIFVYLVENTIKPSKGINK